MAEGTCDIAVIGGGPAGAWAAHLGCARGARVTLFDASHPREKPCGGGITGRALSLVRGAIDVDGLPSVTIDRATFRGKSGRVVDVPLPHRPGQPALVVASRTEFDGALLAAALASGAALVRERVTGVARDGHAFLVTTTRRTYRAARLIGADGANSLVRRRFARAFSRSQLSIATGFFAHGATSRAIALQLVDDPPGYIWSFPRPSHLAVGICAQADAGVTSEALLARTARWIETTKIAPGAPLTRYAWPIPSLTSGDFESLDVAGPGWMLIGDAAGLVDPITREGIYFALDSAHAAVEALASSRAPERAYADRLRAGAIDELARAARFKHGFFRPRFTEFLMDALEESAAVRAVMADLVAGIQGYRGLKWRLAKTMEVRLAWRALAG